MNEETEVKMDAEQEKKTTEKKKSVLSRIREIIMDWLKPFPIPEKPKPREWYVNDPDKVLHIANLMDEWLKDHSRTNKVKFWQYVCDNTDVPKDASVLMPVCNGLSLTFTEIIKEEGE